MSSKDAVTPVLPGQTSLLDGPAAEAAGQEAQTRVSANAPELWKRQAVGVIERIAAQLDHFTTDQVWDALHRFGVDPPPEPRAMAHAMTAARKKKVISPTDQYLKSKRPECHGRPVRVWRANR